jgi:membrane fusion protein (multidrug efflux system)
MKLSARLVTVGILVVLVGAVAAPRFLARPRGGAAPSGARGPGAKARIPVSVHTVRAERLVERLSTTGTLRANEQIEVTSEISGQVTEVRFEEGRKVGAGQVLVVLDDTELRAQRDRSLHRAELAERREARQRQLLKDQMISEQEYELAHTELDVLKAELALVQAQLDKTVVRAPFGGIVGLRYVSPGAHVTPQTTIASLQDLDPMKVDFTVPERYANRLHRGGRVELSIAGLEGSYPAEIYAIEPVVDPATRSIVVRARRSNPDGRLRPGAFADVSVVITEVPLALTVPSVAVIPESGGHKVFVVEDSLAQARPIQTGIRTDTAVEVTSGLKAGDQVIVGGLERVSSGDAVAPRPAE